METWKNNYFHVIGRKFWNALFSRKLNLFYLFIYFILIFRNGNRKLNFFQL